ncbi:hypothetical protein EGR_09329 [Echinococcus granulosus]|uniref:Uncharacterized protein n=1 Tax=Echinococcus granulosus TaxID=6210 RepID=W6U3X7_ECHGR|nr:hypothetical protein EGR_09329 [Echinococcus granulosus]EUB55813.1 hypothetical protein EGR_09329 [Echinococcus granulosus]
MKSVLFFFHLGKCFLIFLFCSMKLILSGGGNDIMDFNGHANIRKKAENNQTWSCSLFCNELATECFLRFRLLVTTVGEESLHISIVCSASIVFLLPLEYRIVRNGFFFLLKPIILAFLSEESRLPLCLFFTKWSVFDSISCKTTTLFKYLSIAMKIKYKALCKKLTGRIFLKWIFFRGIWLTLEQIALPHGSWAVFTMRTIAFTPLTLCFNISLYPKAAISVTTNQSCPCIYHFNFWHIMSSFIFKRVVYKNEPVANSFKPP